MQQPTSTKHLSAQAVALSAQLVCHSLVLLPLLYHMNLLVCWTRRSCINVAQCHSPTESNLGAPWMAHTGSGLLLLPPAGRTPCALIVQSCLSCSWRAGHSATKFACNAATMCLAGPFCRSLAPIHQAGDPFPVKCLQGEPWSGWAWAWPALRCQSILLSLLEKVCVPR